jgi:hypothetical protein
MLKIIKIEIEKNIEKKHERELRVKNRLSFLSLDSDLMVSQSRRINKCIKL